MILFMQSLYQQEIRERIMQSVVVLGVIFGLIVLVTPVRIFSHTVIPFQLITLIAGSYVFQAIVMAAIHGRQGARTFLIGYLVVFIAVINDILHQNFIIQTTYTVPFGLFIFIFCQSFVLSIRFSKAFSTVEAMSHRLLSVDKLKDEFLANTSHELQTPLNGIIGLAESLIDGAKGKMSKAMIEDLSMITSSGKRLSALVSDILDFTRLRNRDIKLNLRAVDFYAMTNLAINLSKPLVMGRPIEIINKVSPEAPHVLGDENRIQQILLNLIINAIKFTEKGEIVICLLYTSPSPRD